MHRGRVVRQALDQWIGTNLERHHVDVHHGRATFVDAHTVRVEGEAEPRLLEGGVILIATGSTPHQPSTIPFAGPGVYDSDTIQQMERLPDRWRRGGRRHRLRVRLPLQGAGAAGSAGHPLRRADPAIRRRRDRQHAARGDGVARHGVRMPDAVEGVEAGPAFEAPAALGETPRGEALLVALGRRGNVAALRLEKCGVRPDEQGQLLVNEHFQTNVPHIYAAGDVIGGHALASTAMEEARMAMDHAFPFGGHFRLNDITAGLKSSRAPAPSCPSGSGRSRRSRWWARPSRACARRAWRTRGGALAVRCQPARHAHRRALGIAQASLLLAG